MSMQLALFTKLACIIPLPYDYELVEGEIHFSSSYYLSGFSTVLGAWFILRKKLLNYECKVNTDKIMEYRQGT